MAQAVPVVIAVIGAAMSVYQGMEQRDAAREQQRIAERNAKREQAEAEEQARRAKREFTAEESLSRARAAASGLDVDKSKSTTIYLNQQKKAHAEEVKWIKKSGASRADITRREGDLSAKITNANAWSSFAQAASQASSAAGQGTSWYEST